MAFRKRFHACPRMGKTNLPNLQRHFFCVFYIMIGKCNVIGKIAHGLYWRQKILYFTKKILPLDLCSQKSKKRRFLKKIGAENLICRNFIFMRWAKKIFICRGVLFITFLYCALSVGQRVGILSHAKNF